MLDPIHTSALPLNLSFIEDKTHSANQLAANTTTVYLTVGLAPVTHFGVAPGAAN